MERPTINQFATLARHLYRHFTWFVSLASVSLTVFHLTGTSPVAIEAHSTSNTVALPIEGIKQKSVRSETVK